MDSNAPGWKSDGKSKTTSTAGESSKSIGRQSPVTTTSPPSTGLPFRESILFVEDSPANRSVQPQEGDARLIASGVKCLRLFQSSSPLGSLVKMLLVQPIWFSNKWGLIWKASVTKSHRLLRFRLVPLGVTTGGRATGFLATPTATCNQAAPSMQKWPSSKGFNTDPDVLEKRMGYPTGWTDVEPSAMPSSPKSSKR